MIVKDIRNLLMDLDDNTRVLITTKGVINGAMRSPRFYSLNSFVAFDVLILADEKIGGFSWKPINQTIKMMKAIKKAKDGKKGYVRLNLKKRS